MKTYMKVKTLNISITVFLAICACQPRKQLVQVKKLDLPSNYKGKNNEASIQQLPKWKEYFDDSLLISLIDSALVNNYDLLIADQNVNKAFAFLIQAKALNKPFVQANLSFGHKKFGKYTMDGVGNYDTKFSNNITKEMVIPEYLPDYYGGFMTNWEIDVWGKLKNKKKASLARFMASSEARNMMQTYIVTEVANAYYELQALDLELDIIRETIKLQTNQLEIIKLEKDVGRSNELAVKQFEAQVLNTKGLEVEIKQEIIFTENYLSQLISNVNTQIQRSKIQFHGSLSNFPSLGIPSDLIHNRPDIKQCALMVEAANAELHSARAAFLPSFKINGGIGLQSFNPKYFLLPESFAYNALGGLVAPIVNRSELKSAFKHASASQIEALYNYQKAILTGYVEVYNQITFVDNLEVMYDLKKDEVFTLNEAIQTVSELYMRGRATYLEIIITRQNALRSSLEMVEIKKRQLDARVNIYKALGGGWDR